MLRKRKFILFVLCGIATFIILTILSLNILTSWEYNRYESYENEIEKKIWDQYYKLPDLYKTRKYDSKTIFYLKNIQNINDTIDLKDIWKYANDVVSKDALYPQNQHLASIINAMKTSKIIKADLDKRGTQLKFLLTLKGDQKVVFKPKWYAIDKIIEGPVYAGKDRVTSEILGFYLSAILHKPFAPISVLRNINVKDDLIPVATKELLATLFYYKNLTCIYGKCFYCKKEDPICSNKDGILNGAIIFNLNVKLKSHRSPWQRTYKSDKKAIWQIKENYCMLIQTKLTKTRLYDLIDAAIFDFLIQNGDRHHYETLQDKVIYLDNGKGLGNPYIHHLDILAPLYQCCFLRKNTWERLLELSGGKMKEIISEIPNIKNIVTESHLNAIEKRLLLIYAAVEYCKNQRSTRL